jgi:hypothetical protein
MKPLLTGFALSATVAVFYTLCTLVEVLFPAQFMGFMNALFHGLDFTKLASTEPYRWTSFAYAVVVMSVWAFAAGVFFAWLHRISSHVQYHGILRHG